MELEKLLNKLIEKGREPFGNYRDIITRYKYDERFFEFNHEWDNMVSIRELVSKESGLWQFVCESKLIEQWKTVHDYVISHITYSYDRGCWWYAPNNSEFWIMMSSLIDERDLEQFLIENIKI